MNSSHKSPSTTSPTLLRPQMQLLSRPAPRLSSPFDDHFDSPTLNSPSPRNSSSPLHLTIHELLLLPPSPHRRPKLHHITKETLDPPPSEATPHRKGKSRTAATIISPRNGRRARRRLEKDIVREERELCPFEDEAGKTRKRRQSKPRPARKEKLNLVSLLPSSTAPTKPEILSRDDQNSLDGMSKLITDLVMWKNAARSTLWFGFGSSLFLSSIFSGDVGFSTISAASHLGILILGLAFFYDSISQRKQKKKKGARLRLTEKEVLRISRLILPVLNAALEKSQEIFSGEPMMTLKVAPVLLFTAKFGYLITLWRLLAIGFFLSFTAPKLYSFYYQQIQQKVEYARNYVLESWRSCSRKKLVATSTAALLWNIFDIKMRIFAAFITMVILRYVHQQSFVGEYVEAAANIDRESMEGEQYQNGGGERQESRAEEPNQTMEVDIPLL